MKGTIADCAPALQNRPRTPAIDVGDTGFTAPPVCQAGKFSADRVRVATPYPYQPRILNRGELAITGRPRNRVRSQPRSTGPARRLRCQTR